MVGLLERNDESIDDATEKSFLDRFGKPIIVGALAAAAIAAGVSSKYVTRHDSKESKVVAQGDDYDLEQHYADVANAGSAHYELGSTFRVIEHTDGTRDYVSTDFDLLRNL